MAIENRQSPPHSPEAAETPIPEFNSTNIVLAVGFFESRSHAEEFEKLGVPRLDEEFVEQTFDMEVD